MEMRIYWRLNKTFPLLTYLSSFLYRFSNPMTLMVILWGLISDSGNANSLPGSPGPGCGPSKTGSSICQGHAGPNQHQITRSCDVIAAVRGTAQAQSGCQVLLLFCHQHLFPFTNGNSLTE